MPLVDINNPDTIKFLIENYEKTTRLRMKWNTIHAKKLNLAATFTKKEKGYREEDVIKDGMYAGMQSIERDHKSGSRNRRLKPIRDGVHIPGIADMRKGHSIVDIGLGDPKDDPRLAQSDTDLTTEPIMRPVDPKTKKILYKVKPTFGRQVYLNSRCTHAVPEDRFYFAETSGWVYGWRLKDSYFNRNTPIHGRVWRLAREVSRSGPQPDPIHYKSVTRGATTCPDS